MIVLVENIFFWLYFWYIFGIIVYICFVVFFEDKVLFFVDDVLIFELLMEILFCGLVIDLWL